MKKVKNHVKRATGRLYIQIKRSILQLTADIKKFVPLPIDGANLDLIEFEITFFVQNLQFHGWDIIRYESNKFYCVLTY